MNRQQWLEIGTLIGLIFLGTVVLVAYILTRPNPHYVAGRNYLTIKEFEIAEQEFKLCLEEDENNQDAAGLLIYAHVRRLIDESDLDPEVLRPRLTEWVEDRLTKLILSGKIKHDLSPQDQTRWQKNIRDERERLRNEIRDLRIHTDTWTDALKLGRHALVLINGLEVDSDDEYDWYFHALSTAILALEGDLDKAQELVSLSVENPEAAVFLHFAGTGILEPLRAELSNKESLLRKEGMSELRSLASSDQVAQFAALHPSLRKLKKSDFKGKDKIYWDRRLEDYVSSPQMIEYYLHFHWYLDPVIQGKLDNLSFRVQQSTWKEGEMAILMVDGLDAQKQRFCGQLYLWDDSALSWAPLKLVINKVEKPEFESPHIFDLEEKFNEEKSRVAITVFQGSIRTITETEWREETVVRHRQVGDFFFGYRDEAYTTTENVPHQVEKTVETIMSENHYFQLQPKTRKLVFIKKTQEYD